MGSLADVLNSISGWEVLGLIVALGAVTMALLQLIIDLTPLRIVFNFWSLTRWFDQRKFEYKQYKDREPSESPFPRERPFREPLPDVKVEAAKAQLIAQATGGNLRSFLGLAPAQLVAQVNAAAQAALENPKLYFDLLALLSQPAVPRLSLRTTTAQRDTFADQVQFGQHYSDLAFVQRLSGEYPDSESSELKPYLDARARLMHHIQRNLDSMQIGLSNDSALASQIFAVILSVCIAYFIVRTAEPNNPAPFLLTLVFGVAGGYAAPILGDIVAAIRRLGRA